MSEIADLLKAILKELKRSTLIQEESFELHKRQFEIWRAEVKGINQITAETNEELRKLREVIPE